MKHKSTFLLLCIVIVAFFLRFYRLGEIPYGFYQDESAIGFNAYSILETGKDEYGKVFPLYFKSFGDHKLPVYIYLTAVSEMVFGLTEFAVRLPSALFGFLTVIITYFFTRDITKNKTIALIATALLAINPWHLHYNRATFEVSVALFFFLLGSWSIYRAFHTKLKGGFLLGVLCFFVTLYAYNLTRLLSPLLFTLVVWYSMKETKQRIAKKEVILAAILSFILAIPFIMTLFQSGGVSSASGTLIFSSAQVQAPLVEFRSYLVDLPGPFSKLFFNSFFLTSVQYFDNILSYFSASFFFIVGSSHGNHGIGNVGQFYLFELLFMIVGFITIINKKVRYGYLALLWGAIVVLVASLTREAPHATRSFFLIFPLVLLSAHGVYQLFLWSPQLHRRVRVILIAFLCSFIVYNVVYYFTSYYVRFPLLYAKSWRSEDKAVALFIKENESKYAKVIFDKDAGFMYSSLLFYLPYSPSEFQGTVKREPDNKEGFSTVQSFGKYEFRAIDWDKDIKEKNVLIITRHDKKPENVPPLKAFYYPKRPVAFSVDQEVVSYPIEEIAYVAVETNK